MMDKVLTHKPVHKKKTSAYHGRTSRMFSKPKNLKMKFIEDDELQGYLTQRCTRMRRKQSGLALAPAQGPTC